jgi:Spy/CpxP family protein refolding chaperone
MNKPWQVIAVLMGIFAAGGATGSFVTLRICKDKALNRPVPEEWTPRALKSLDERLDLTPDQREQIRPVVRNHMEQVNRLRNSSMAETRLIIEDMQHEISSRLTPDQRTKYEQMNREARDKREKREKADRERREKGDRPTPAADGKLAEPAGEKTPPKPPGT